MHSEVTTFLIGSRLRDGSAMNVPCLVSAIASSDAHHIFLRGVVKGEDFY